jgi:transposase
MERLESKRIHGHTYYYYSRWAWAGGKCRRVWQKYLGKLDDLVRAVEGGGPAPKYAEIFQWGLPQALWQEVCQADLVGLIDRHCRKRGQGLSAGQYLAIAALNRAMQPRSKRSLWHWFVGTVLLRHLPDATPTSLTSQRFWDHMDRIDAATAAAIWKDLLQGVVHREALDLSRISYDGTNFYTFIDTFNTRCQLARRGKNKQGRSNLRQISYGLFCCGDGQLPLYYDVYEGNRNDARQFPLMLERFRSFFRDLSGNAQAEPDTTLIFDKGNNSQENFHLLDALGLSYVGSVKLDEHKDLAAVSNHDARWQTSADYPPGSKSFRVKKKVYGRERLILVTYNQNLFEAQWLTVQNDLQQALERLGQLRARLDDRRSGLIRGGRVPSVAAIDKQCQTIRKRQHLKKLIGCHVEADASGVPRLEYSLDMEAQRVLCDTYLGKNLLITDRVSWSDARIITAYRSQYLIEGVFKETKDHDVGAWWPLFHWTDSKIRVHALYCSIALLLRGLACRRAQKAGLKITMKRFLAELAAIREVVTIYPRRRKQPTPSQQTVVTRTSELQDQLIEILDLRRPEKPVLG